MNWGRNVSVSPVAAYPFKTLLHEIGHVQLLHTSDEQIAEYRTHRGLKEFQAEGTSYLVLNELGATDQFDASESRSYIQGWLRGERPSESSIKQVFSAADAIIKAGREDPTVAEESEAA